MQFLAFLHDRLSVTMLLFMLALGVWGLWNFLRGEGMSGSYLGGLVIGEGLIVVQTLIGLALLLGGAVAVRHWLHILYGIAVVITLPAMFAFTRGRTSRSEALMYAVVAFFIAGLTVRLQTTGGG
jgi:hypothetical protein